MNVLKVLIDSKNKNEKLMLGIVPTQKQKDVILSNGRLTVENFARQEGCSTTALLAIYRYSYENAGITSLLLCNTSAIACKMMQNILTLISGSAMKDVVVKIVRRSSHGSHIVLSNGSIIYFESVTSNFRGKKFNCLVVDGVNISRNFLINSVAFLSDKVIFLQQD